MGITKKLAEKAKKEGHKEKVVITGPGFMEEHVVKEHKETILIKEANGGKEGIRVFTKKF